MENDHVGIGIETEKGTFDLSQALMIFQKAKGIKNPVCIDFLQILVEMGYCSGEMLRQIMDESWVQSKQEELRLDQDFRIELPIARPSKIICLGRNYKAHAKELDHDVPEEPLFFCKAPSTLIPHESEIVIPKWLDGRVDHEAELALIIGKQGQEHFRERRHGSHCGIHHRQRRHGPGHAKTGHLEEQTLVPLQKPGHLLPDGPLPDPRRSNPRPAQPGDPSHSE